MTSTRPRVIVGITGSVSNLRALREATATARDRGAVLYAVHVWETGDNVETARATAHKPGVLRGVRSVHRAFAEAMGGRPHDVDVRVVVVEGRPEVRLVTLAHRDTDLLVLGTGARPWWRPRLRRSVATACVRRARCPVLVVPPGEMAREVAGRPRISFGALPSSPRNAT